MCNIVKMTKAQRLAFETQYKRQAKVVCSFFTMESCCWYLFHRGSFAANAAMLHSPKPMIMRDIFLTRSDASYPNPAGVLYYSSAVDLFSCLYATWTFIYPMACCIGARHILAVYFGGALFSSFAYLFQVQCSPKKVNTPYDVSSNAVGGVAALATLTFTQGAPKLNALFTKIPMHYAAAPVIGVLLWDEYIKPKFYPPERGIPQVTCWGSVGGMFFGLMYGTMMLGVKKDASMLKTFWSNMPKKAAA